MIQSRNSAFGVNGLRAERFEELFKIEGAVLASKSTLSARRLWPLLWPQNAASEQHCRPPHVPLKMGRASRKGKKKPGQHTRNPRGGKPGRPSRAEVAERERKKKQAERMQRSRENRKRQREELGAGPSGPEPMPDMSVLGAKSTSNNKVKQSVDLAEEIAGGDKEKYAALVEGLIKHPSSGDYRSRIQEPWPEEAEAATAAVQDMAGTS